MRSELNEPVAAPLPSRGGALARCTGPGAATFGRDHWSRTPLLSRGAGPFTDLLSDADVDELIDARALREPFFRTVRQGAGQPPPTRTVTAGNQRIHVVDPERLAGQYAEGATLVLNALHRNHPPVVRFCRELASELGHPTQCNAYVTPGGQAQGFAFHHDTHDVFVLQASGRKRWIVHEPVLSLPLPSQPRAGDDLVAEGAEPLLDVVLEAGDCLYLPRGFVHAAVTTDEHSVHLTVGVLSTTWYDVLQDVLTLAAEVPEFRDALPLAPDEALPEQLPGLLKRAADWLAGLDPAEVEQVVRRRLARAVPPEPVRLLATAAAVRTLTLDTAVRPRRTGVSARDGDTVTLTLPDRTLTLPAVAAEALERAVSGPARVADLAVGGLDVDDALVLARRLLREGVLAPGATGTG